MQLKFLGTRGYIEAKSRLHRMHSSLLITHGRSRIMIDCGEQWKGRLSEINPHHIVITHAHPDHAFGLSEGSPSLVWATKETWERISHFPIPKAKRRLLTPHKKRLIGGVGFQPFPVIHSIRAPAVGYRITSGKKAFFYIPDVAWIPHRRAAFKGISLYIGDGASLTRPLIRRDKTTGQLFGHTTVRRQLAWCQKEGVPQMIITHCGSQIVTGDARKIAKQLKEWTLSYGVSVIMARDGMEIDLSKYVITI